MDEILTTYLGSALAWVGTSPEASAYRLAVLVLALLGAASEIVGTVLRLPSYSFIHRLSQLAWLALRPVRNLGRAGTAAAARLTRERPRRRQEDVTRLEAEVADLRKRFEAMTPPSPPPGGGPTP